ncbi:hypothetical protein R1flu_011813 [Riccia fluitans]|uniref:CCHC-type domain-containing protein n=1 Tax=Riccia fluitans TaxID=41844 RepID=A0ABD1Z8V5_9MARC
MDEGGSDLGVNRVGNVAVVDQGDVQMADNQMITGSAEMLDQLNGEGNWIGGTQPYYKGIREQNIVQAKTGGATENFRFDVGIDNNLENFPALVPTTGQNPFGSENTLPRENPREQLGALGVQLIAQEGIAQQRQLLSTMRPITANDAEQKLQFMFGEIKGGGASKGSPGEVNSTRSFATTAKNAWETPLQLTEKAPKKNDTAGELLRPYLENLDPSWGTNVSEDHLLQVFNSIRQHELPGDRKESIKIHPDPMWSKIRIDQLSKGGVILHTMEITPTRAQVIEWAEVRLKRDLGLEIIQIRALSRKHFLISLASEDQKLAALSTKEPFYMFRKMVFLSMTHDLNPTRIYANRLPVWLDLPRVHPLVEQYGDEMLDAIGEVLYKTIDKQTNQYVNISACVLIDLAKPLKDAVDVEIYGETVWSQVIRYRRLPDMCFNCQQRGHWVRECPKWAEGQTEENHVNKAENRDVGKPGEADQKGKEPVKEVGKVETSQAESSFSTGNRGTIKTGNDGFQLVSRKRNRRGQGKASVLDKGGQLKDTRLRKEQIRDPNGRAFRRLQGIYSDGSVAKEDESETDKESDGTRDDGESSDSEMEENMEEERTGNNTEGDFQDILSQNVPSLSKLEEEILLQKEGTEAMNRETSAEILPEAHAGEGTSTMLAFENQAFSPDLTVIEKRRVIDGEDKEGFRRQSLHPAAIQTRLFTEQRGGGTQVEFSADSSSKAGKDKNKNMREGGANKQGVSRRQQHRKSRKGEAASGANSKTFK